MLLHKAALAPLPGLTMRFDVHIDDIDLGGWATCAGLEVNFGLLEWKEGGTNTHSYWLPDRVKYEKITLTRPMTKEDSGKLSRWLSRCIDKEEGGTAKITLRDAHASEVCSWSLRNVLPSSWKGPQLDATGTKVAFETLVLVHEGFL